MTTLSTKVLDVQAEVIAAIIAGGYVTICEGAMPNVDTNPAEIVLVRCPIPAALPTITKGAFTVVPEPAKITMEGKADYFRVYSAKNVLVWQGSCGTDASADMTMESTLLPKGSMLSVEELRYEVLQGA